VPTARRLFTAGALASVASLAVVGGAKAQAHGDVASLAVAVEAFRVAMHKADKEAFGKLCSEALSYGHSAGRIETKAEFIAASTSGRSVWKSIAFNDVVNQVSGLDGISRMTLIGQTESEGKTNDIKIGVLMVWRHEMGSWKLFARQAFRL